MKNKNRAGCRRRPQLNLYALLQVIQTGRPVKITLRIAYGNKDQEPQQILLLRR
jgi:hypothetical protein